jgi:predicted nucleotidyltransferase
MKYLKELTRKKIIKKYHKKGKFPHFEANRLSRTYRYEKSHALITKILQSGLIEELEKLKPKTITIFGSAKKGTYHKKSDIDIFIQTTPKKINLTNYEHKLKHKINLLFEENLKNLTPGLLENIYNGETISGKLEVTT